MRVLIACEYSGETRRAFKARGHDVMSCDLLPSYDNSPDHFQGDVRYVIDAAYRNGGRGFDLMIAHPNCTYLTNSGVCHLHTDPTRWAKLDDAAEFFRYFLNCPIPKKAIENPIMHKYAIERIGGVKQTQIIHPWMFGHMEQKATCLWLDGLPKLKETNNVKVEMMKLPKRDRERLHYLPPGPDRWKERSRTFSGIAEAFAEQWGTL